MTKTTLNLPDDPNMSGDPCTKPNLKKSLRFNERALCRAFINKFYTMGILTSSETGLIINKIDQGSRPTL